jgi:hypothetical protein
VGAKQNTRSPHGAGVLLLLQMVMVAAADGRPDTRSFTAVYKQLPSMELTYKPTQVCSRALLAQLPTPGATILPKHVTTRVGIRALKAQQQGNAAAV